MGKYRVKWYVDVPEGSYPSGTVAVESLDIDSAVAHVKKLIASERRLVPTDVRVKSVTIEKEQRS